MKSKIKNKKNIRKIKTMKMRKQMIMGNVPNPFKVDTKMASAGVDKMKMGAGIFVKVRF